MSALPITRSITDKERNLRSEAVSYARASVALEGFQLTSADEQHAARFINGEIDLPEFVKLPSKIRTQTGKADSAVNRFACSFKWHPTTAMETVRLWRPSNPACVQRPDRARSHVARPGRFDNSALRHRGASVDSRSADHRLHSYYFPIWPLYRVERGYAVKFLGACMDAAERRSYPIEKLPGGTCRRSEG